MHVYYPVKKSNWTKFNSPRGTGVDKFKFLPFGDRCLEAIQAAEVFLFEIAYMPKSRHLLDVEIESIPNALYDLNEGKD